MAFNIVWLINCVGRYGKYAKAVGLDPDTKVFYSSNSKTNFAVMLPTYPTFDGMLSLDYMCEEGSYNFMIYPKLIKGYEIGFSYVDNERNQKAEIWFDEDMNIIEEYTEEGTIEEYEQRINEMCDIVSEKWGIWIYAKE